MKHYPADVDNPTEGDNAAAAVDAGTPTKNLHAPLIEDRPLLSTALAAQVHAQLARSVSGSLDTSQVVRALGQALSVIASRQGEQEARVRENLSKILGSFAQNSAAVVAGWSGALTRAADYRNPDPPKGAYSDAMSSPASYYARDEMVVDSMADLSSGISTLVDKTSELPLVWRGARDADWGVHSHLFRHLCEVNGVKAPQKKPKQSQPYPDEDQMVRAEREILRIARTDWRFDGMSALETFARIQHAGGPTRLLDVTKNPYIAAWFAVEQNGETDGHDARLVAFATRPVAKTGKPAAGDSVIQLDAEWADRTPPWHFWTDSIARQSVDWGTGARRRIWVPPAYDPRILAQNAAFLLDGVPITSAKTASYFRSNDSTEPARYWNRADLLAASSVYAKTLKPTRKPRYNAPNLAPTFTFRIVANAKREIREFLEERFGYTRSYVYPDITALAGHLNELPLSEA